MIFTRNSSIFYLLISQCLFLNLVTYSQNIEARDSIRHFAGSISITNNGISLLPTFTLGKPAAIFNMSLGNKKLSFEPEFRMSLEGKPWSIIFWWRYKMANTNKFKFNIGAHPSLVFRTVSTIENGVEKNSIEAQRFFAGELSPNYILNKHVSIGLYYLYGRGIEKNATKNTHFLTLNSNISNIKLTKQVFMRITPQVFYLKMDNNDGYYFTGSLGITDMRYPFSVTGVINQVIKTNIVSQDFIWNITLSYSFIHSYVKR